MPSEINFFAEEVEMPIDHLDQVEAWIQQVIASYDVQISTVNYIYCTDQYVKELNIKYLNHDYSTDIITFETTSPEGVSGDIYMSVDTIIQNAIRFSTTPENEFYRVLAHGLLHLMGYKDKTADEFAEMKRQEDYCLSLQSFN